MPNYFTDNPDLRFQFEHLDLEEIVEVLEDGYRYAAEYAEAPTDLADARDNYRRILELVGDLAANSFAPRAAAVDAEGATLKDGRVSYAAGTRQNLAELAQADLMGALLPYRFGGLNVPFTVHTLAVEITARADAGLMNLLGLQDVGDCINKYGTEEQRTRYLPKLASGEHTCAMALTEPEAGSDLQAVRLVASQDEHGQWRLRGVKRFITNGCGNVLLVLARSEPNTRDGRGLSMFVCEPDASLTVRRLEHKLGIRGSPTCELSFDGTPAELVGKRKFGLIKYVLDLMFRARVGIAAQAQGIAQAAYDEALRYARARVQFGKPICEIPAVANLLLGMQAELQANRALLYAAAVAVDRKERRDEAVARRKSAGEPLGDAGRLAKEAMRLANLLTPLAKLVLTESANRIVYDGLQVHGGPGYMKDFAIERLARDVRITTIYEGTSQLQVVAAIGGVMTDVLQDFFGAHEARAYADELTELARHVTEIRRLGLEARRQVSDRRDATFQEAAARDLVELYGRAYTGWLLLDQAAAEPTRIPTAARHIRDSLAHARRSAETVALGLYEDVARASDLLA